MLRDLFIFLISGGFLLLWADPIAPTIINEFKVYEDSLVMLELSVQPMGGFYVDSIVTSRETKIVNEEIGSGDYRIIPSLLINEKGDTIKVYIDEFKDPYETFYTNIKSPSPDASLSLIWYKPDIDEYHYYFDFTPTFGYPNDDYGFIWGKVKDNNGNGIVGAEVKAVGPYDKCVGYCWGSEAGYELALGVGRYYLTAEAKGYKTQVYPESVEVKGGDKIRIDFTLLPLGVEESEIPISGPIYLTASSPSIRRTKITVHIPVSSHINLKIYDALGHRVKVLLNKEKKAGIYTYEWDGCDSKGKKVSPGLYFVSLEAGKLSLTCKLILAK